MESKYWQLGEDFDSIQKRRWYHKFGWWQMLSTFGYLFEWLCTDMQDLFYLLVYCLAFMLQRDWNWGCICSPQSFLPHHPWRLVLIIHESILGSRNIFISNNTIATSSTYFYQLFYGMNTIFAISANNLTNSRNFILNIIGRPGICYVVINTLSTA